MAYLSERERISLLMMRGWDDRQRSYNEVRQIFNETFRDENTAISRSTVERTVRRFNETGSVKNRQIPGRPISAIGEEKQLDVAQLFVENVHLSIRKVNQQHDISRMFVQRILKKIKFYPYKIHLVQELSEDDFDRRMEFYDVMMRKTDDDSNFVFNVIFSDEATFELNGLVNRHNCRFWSDNNPHWMLEDHTQYPHKLTVWADMLNNTLIGPFFIDGNLNSAKYEDMLRNEIVPAQSEGLWEITLLIYGFSKTVLDRIMVEVYETS